MQEFIKKIRYLLEAALTWLAIGFFRILPVKMASDFGAFLAKLIGKRHSSNGLARQNMKNALGFSDERVSQELDKMWDNLGRIIGEYPHISYMNSKKLYNNHIFVSDETKENLKIIKHGQSQAGGKKKGGLIVSAHIGNWEIGPTFFANNDIQICTVYRPLNNPYVENMTAKMRGTKLIAKSSKGNREIIQAIKEGKYVVILVDQKVSEGEEIQFFHDRAITTTSLARIALKYNVDLIPTRSIRRGPLDFEVRVEKPIEYKKTDDLKQDLKMITRQINARLEDWIRQYPAQWFWVHDRWKK